MQFHSLAEFIAMGGHGAFVWSAYGIATVVLVSLALAPILKSRRFWSQQTMRVKRQQGGAAIRAGESGSSI